jgi:prepilin-type N-terminal cleavage/methylation domain-containing protein
MSYVKKTRTGFTLGEVLVTVAIISVLAAVVIPSVTSQISKGDLGRVGQDLQAIRGAVEQFSSDVRRYPKSLGQLAVRPLVTETPINSTTVYTLQDVAQWRGPYLTKDSVAAGVTGYGLKIGIGAVASKFDTMTVGSADIVSTAGVGNVLYLVVPIAGMDQTTALALDAAVDDGVLTTGAVRWKAKGAGVADTLKFLAMPIIK